jgi:hypothetical protein
MLSSGTETPGSMPSGQVYWHLYNYPTRAAADANKTANGTVIESFGKIWLYTITKEGWRPPSGERVAVIGPFSVTAPADATQLDTWRLTSHRV